jgi:uncharacterized protein YegL
MTGRYGRGRGVRDATNGRVYINHVVFVLDASGSMSNKRRKLIEVVDNQIKNLATQSKTFNQETRVTVYAFDDEVVCLFFDVDVLRLPSIAQYYEIKGMTALIDATLYSQEDLRKTATMYGDHAFLTYVLTDGMENASLRDHSELARWMSNLAENETVAVFVPDQQGMHAVRRYGFPVDNIAIWDASSARGVEQVGATMEQATTSYYTMRSKGGRATRSLFTGGAQQVNTQTVAAAGLVPLTPEMFAMHAVRDVGTLAIRPYCELMTGRKYRTGEAFYQLTKPETVQAQKTVAVRRKKTNEIYVGKNARDLLGLPPESVRVRPDHNPEFDVFIQSTSVNRKLVVGTELMVLAAGVL